MYDIFLICPVRNATEEQKLRMNDYISNLEAKGIKIYYPARDTNQDDSIGWQICTDNKNAIIQSKEIHIFWDKDSLGTLFDLGMVFALNKNLTIINIDETEETQTKSFSKMIRNWHDISV